MRYHLLEYTTPRVPVRALKDKMFIPVDEAQHKGQKVNIF
jgi:hypothetical protein